MTHHSPSLRPLPQRQTEAPSPSLALFWQTRNEALRKLLLACQAQANWAAVDRPDKADLELEATGTVDAITQLLMLALGGEAGR
jgi:hypothetical protein